MPTAQEGATSALRSNDITSPLQRAFSRKKVFILTHEISMTGAPRVCTELAAMLRQAGARVIIATHPGGTKASSAEDMAHEVSGIMPSDAGLDLLTDAPTKVASTADLVIVSTMVPQQAAWLRRFREAYPTYPALTWWIHEGASSVNIFSSPPTEIHEAADIMAEHRPRIVDATVFPSWSTRSWWMEQIGRDGHPATVTRLPEAAAVIHWGLPKWRARQMDSARSNTTLRASSRARRSFQKDDFVFVVLGSFHPLKGYAGILKAFDVARKMCGPSLRIAFCGTPYNIDELRAPELAWMIHDDAVWLESFTTDVPAFLAAGDAYISNTKAGGETWGLATLEALAMGLPVLASRAGGSTEMVEHNVTALMHDVANVVHIEDDTSQEVPQLAENMCALVKDGALRERLSSAGRQLVSSQLSQSKMEEAIVHTFAGMLHSSAVWRGAEAVE